MTSPLLLERAGLADLDALAAIEQRSYSHPWSLRAFAGELALGPGQGGVLVLRAPFPAGDPERGIRAYCAFRLVADELHIHNLAVHPERLRGGLGRRLLRLTLDLGLRHGARLALLEVRESNRAALALYAATGFERLANRRDYYERPREDALVLAKALAGAGVPGVPTRA